jgi:putative photosynthetic complex assembly protein
MNATTHQPFPRGALVGGAAMVGFSLLLATIVRLSGADISSMPAARPVLTRSLQFVDAPDGAVIVYDARSHQQIQSLPPGTNGFVRATMRNFARERRSNSVGEDIPFELIASQDGRLVLDDPATGRHIDLEAFGQTNAGVFAGFLDTAGPRRSP